MHNINNDVNNYVNTNNKVENETLTTCVQNVSQCFDHQLAEQDVITLLK